MARTLIIDDDPTTEPVIREHLERTDTAQSGPTDVTVVGSDTEAIALLNEGADFDIALVAIDSDAISGMSVFLKITERRLRIPRIALTGDGDLRAIRKAMNEGATDFLIKPFSADDLAVTIDRVLDDVNRRRRNWQERSDFSALKREVDIAADIQKRILPQEFPSPPGYGIAAANTAAKVMGGDFYDVFLLDPDDSWGPVGVVMADVSGKGIPAAFYMAVARTLLRSVAMTGAEPVTVMTQVNELLCDHHIPGMFVSTLYGVLNAQNNTFTFTNAGHQPPYHGGNGAALITHEGGEGTVLGVMSGMDFGQETIKLAEGDFLYMYTDGVTEAFNDAREQFSEERLEGCLIANDGLNASGLVEAVEAAVAAHAAGAQQSDDITGLVVKRT